MNIMRNILHDSIVRVRDEAEPLDGGLIMKVRRRGKELIEYTALEICFLRRLNGNTMVIFHKLIILRYVSHRKQVELMSGLWICPDGKHGALMSVVWSRGCK